MEVRAVALKRGAGQLRAALAVAPRVLGELLVDRRVPGGCPIVRDAGLDLALLEGAVGNQVGFRGVAERRGIQYEENEENSAFQHNDKSNH